MTTSSNNNNNNNNSNYIKYRNDDSIKINLKQINANDLTIDKTGELLALSSRNGLLLFKINSSSIPSSPSLLSTSSNNNSLQQQFSSTPTTPSSTNTNNNVPPPSPCLSVTSTSSSNISNNNNNYLSILLHKNKKTEVNSAQFSPDSNTLACTIGDSIHIYDLNKTSNNLIENEMTIIKNAHQRNINSLIYSPHDSNLLASCSADGFIYIWDLRQHQSSSINKKAIQTFISYTDVPTSLSWNPLKNPILASSHNLEVRIWDIRKSEYITYLSAHSSLITGMDWSPYNENELVTCGCDKYIKIWDIGKTNLKGSKKLNIPIWKVRYTPFGKGLITISKKENSLRCWKIMEDNNIENVSVFSGHNDEIKCFDFRNFNNLTTNNNKNENFQVVSYSKDYSLRFWNFNTQLKDDLMNVENSNTLLNKINNSRAIAINNNNNNGNVNNEMKSGSYNSNNGSVGSSRNFSSSLGSNNNNNGLIMMNHVNNNNNNNNINHSSSLTRDLENDGQYLLNSIYGNNLMHDSIFDQEHSFDKEMSQVEELFKSILKIEKINTLERYSIITMIDSMKQTQLKLKISFPQLYPMNASPSFEILPSKTFISVNDLKAILNCLNNTAIEHVTKCRPCIYYCMKNVWNVFHSNLSSLREKKEGELDVISNNNNHLHVNNNNNGDVISSNSSSGNGLPRIASVKVLNILENTAIAHPYCGARFSPNGQLIYFNSFSHRGNVVTKMVNFRYYDEMVQDFKTPFSIRPKKEDKLLNTPQKEKKEAQYFSSVYNDFHNTIDEEEDLEERGDISFHDTRTDDRIHVYDVKYLLPISYSLASKYNLIGANAQLVCLQNVEICQTENRFDLSKMWKILSQIVDVKLLCSSGPGNYWAQHALGRRFVKNLLNHFLRKRDIQTCAIMTCVLRMVRHELALELDKMPLTKLTVDQCDLMDVEMRKIMNHVCLCYSKLLHSWGFHLQRCEITKYVNTLTNQQFMNGTSKCDIEFEQYPLQQQQQQVIKEGTTLTPRSGEVNRQQALSSQLQQQQTKKTFLTCSLCRVPVRGVCVYCYNCGHGGHIEHMQKWFSSNDTCPAGCGCSCLDFMPNYPVSKARKKDISVITHSGSQSMTNNPVTNRNFGLKHSTSIPTNLSKNQQVNGESLHNTPSSATSSLGLNNNHFHFNLLN
ncbi:hypothetical protein ABK040_012840 [Willaertia magna]